MVVRYLHHSYQELCQLLISAATLAAIAGPDIASTAVIIDTMSIAHREVADFRSEGLRVEGC